MPLPIDAGAWDETRLVAEIAARLPKGWKWEVRQAENNFWVVTLTNSEGAPELEEAQAHAQLALLNALGWLEMRAHKTENRASPWAPRRGDFTDRPHDRLFKLQAGGDPPDLDPREIASVYSRSRKPK